MRPRLATLGEIEAAVWQQLERATSDRHHAFRVPVLATVCGEAADARTVVLREATRTTARLSFFTDVRSPKVAQIESCPGGTMVFWSASLHWQLRVAVALSVHKDGPRVDSVWARVATGGAARDYLTAAAPGAALDDPAGCAVGERGHLAIVDAQIASVDWLELSGDAGGHRRARFEGGRSSWLVP